MLAIGKFTNVNSTSSYLESEQMLIQSHHIWKVCNVNSTSYLDSLQMLIQYQYIWKYHTGYFNLAIPERRP